MALKVNILNMIASNCISGWGSETCWVCVMAQNELQREL